MKVWDLFLTDRKSFQYFMIYKPTVGLLAKYVNKASSI